MITKTTFQFLKDLKANNNRDWFTKNKGRYETAKAEFEVFVDGLITRIAKFDKTVAQVKAKDCVFRIYRDVRFSKDKSPYKTNFGAHITAASKKSEIHNRAGYYIHLEPGASMLAGGAYLPEAAWLNAIRAEIDYHGKEFKKIINSAAFKKYFGELEGDKLVKAPKGYDPEHPDIELLKLKSFLAAHYPNDKQVQDKDFATYAAQVYKTYYPFAQFLNRTLE